MPAIENKIADAVLKRVRALQTAGTGGETPMAVDSREETRKSVSVREAQFSDFERVYALNQSLEQGPDSIENWRRLWSDNPALSGGRDGGPIGWVLEGSQGLVGFLGSIPLQYEFEGSLLRVAATCRFAVEPAYRAFSHLLAVSFFRQKNVDLFVNNTATVAAGKIMAALKASPMPQSDYGTVLFWVLDARPFANAVLEKMEVTGPLRRAGATVAALALKADTAMRGRVPKAAHSNYRIEKMAVGDMGPEFDELWSDWAQQSSRLRARRNREVMRWHFDPPGNRRTVVVLGCYAGDKLLGYAIVRHEHENQGEMRRSVVADLVVRRADPEILDALLAASCADARDAGCHMLEVMGFPERIREGLRRWKPYERRYPAHPFFFKARDPRLHEKLLNKDAWYACPFDGDSTLWP